MVDNAGKQNTQGAAEIGSELTDVINLIHGASNVKEIILDIKEKILGLVGAERILATGAITVNRSAIATSALTIMSINKVALKIK